MEFRRRQKMRRILLSRTTIVILAIIVFLLARGAWGVYEKNREAEARLAQTQREYDALKEQQAFLEENNARLHTEEGVEEEIRENFGLGKEGERVIVVVTPETETATSSSGEDGWWERIKNWFRRN